MIHFTYLNNLVKTAEKKCPTVSCRYSLFEQLSLLVESFDTMSLADGVCTPIFHEYFSNIERAVYTFHIHCFTYRKSNGTNQTTRTNTEQGRLSLLLPTSFIWLLL